MIFLWLAFLLTVCLFRLRTVCMKRYLMHERHVCANGRHELRTLVHEGNNVVHVAPRTKQFSAMVTEFPRAVFRCSEATVTHRVRRAAECHKTWFDSITTEWIEVACSHSVLRSVGSFSPRYFQGATVFSRNSRTTKKPKWKTLCGFEPQS